MSKGVIGNLRVNMGLDSAQFQAGLKSAQTSAERFSKALKTSMAAAAATAAAALGGIAVGVRNAMKSADELSKMAQKIGIPTEELSKLKYAADMSGVSLQGLQTAVGRLSRNMSDAAKGTGEGAKAFKALGISVKGSDGTLKSSSAVMTELADKFAKMPDGAQKTALAMELMGRSGADMIPMLNGGSAALNELMAEAKALGLEISTSTGRAAEAFNDNISRMGYAISGLTLGITAALAPALVVVTDGMVAVTKAVLKGLEYLPVLAEYAAVAGGALAVMAGPAILSSIGSMTVAIGTGLVGAVKILTAAIVANPLGALAVGIAAAVTAVYHFRDEIQKAIGVDVVGIVKAAANYILNSFRAAYEDLKFIWGNFGNIMGAAVIGGVNVAIKAINSLANSAKVVMNDLIDTMNMIPGVSIGKFNVGDVVGQIANPYANAMEKTLKQHGERIKQIMSEDLIGAMGSAFELSTPAVLNLNNALETISTGAGGAASKLKEMQAEAARIFEATRTPLEQYQAQIARLNELLAAGAINQDTYNRAVAQAQDAFQKAEEAGNKARQTMEQIGQSIAWTFSSAFQGLIDGSKKVKDVLKDLLSQLGQMLMNSAFQALFSGGSAGGGILGSLFGGFKIPGFATGTNYAPGGLAWVGERGPELVNLPRGSQVIPNHKLGERGGGVNVPVNINIDATGADAAGLARVEQQVAKLQRDLPATVISTVRKAQNSNMKLA